MQREVCANPRCGHHKTSHHAELESTGDVTNPGKPGRVVYHSCLATWCECKWYEPEAS